MSPEPSLLWDLSVLRINDGHKFRVDFMRFQDNFQYAIGDGPDLARPGCGAPKRGESSGNWRERFTLTMPSS
jgi:hypothetical protein